MASRLRSRFASLVLVLVPALLAAGNVSAADRRESRSVTGFSAIALSAPLKVELAQGDSESVVLEGDEGELADIETVVESSTLMIRPRNRISFSRGLKVRALVTAKNIEAINISGSGDIQAQSLRTPRLKVAISGSGDLRIATLAATNLEVSIAGSGDFTAAGKVDTMATRISGSGDVKMGKLEARQVKVTIAGSGNALVWAKESLGVSVAGSGDVRYHGDPTVEKSISGSGSVKRLGPAPT